MMEKYVGRKAAKTANRLYRYTAMTEEKNKISKKVADIKDIKDNITDSKEEKDVKSGIIMKDNFMGADFGSDILLEKMREAVIWTEILSKPLSRRKRRR